MIQALKVLKAKISGRSGGWPKVRDEFLKIQGECQACGRKKRLTVHHIIPVHVDKSKELDPANFITLCSICHFVFGHFFSWRTFNENVKADAAEFIKKLGAL